MKTKHYDIKIISDYGSHEQGDTLGELYFDDLPQSIQENIIDLIASIIENKNNSKKEVS
ncbi:hypothetical protein [Desulfobacterium sp. N47]|uniref:Uncharacterized protein n=1 Tax=uncultured Desulfobacterium sp. TaxID=201089 RepID=E1Y988_9BACT|nr:unknown protein [uncultured Desulfobacterium sp.]